MWGYLMYEGIPLYVMVPMYTMHYIGILFYCARVTISQPKLLGQVSLKHWSAVW